MKRALWVAVAVWLGACERPTAVQVRDGVESTEQRLLAADSANVRSGLMGLIGTARLYSSNPDAPTDTLTAVRDGRLTIVGDSMRWYALIPDGVVAEVAVTDYKAWAIHSGEHQIVLVRDSVYRICQLPCTKLDRIMLSSKGAASWKALAPPDSTDGML